MLLPSGRQSLQAPGSYFCPDGGPGGGVTLCNSGPLETFSAGQQSLPRLAVRKCEQRLMNSQQKQAWRQLQSLAEHHPKDSPERQNLQRRAKELPADYRVGCHRLLLASICGRRQQHE